MISRRHFLLAGVGATSAVLAGRWWWHEQRPPVQVDWTGMQMGHAVRQPVQLSDYPLSGKCKALIVGSGAAGLTAAWQLEKQGYHDYLLVSGPERFGNASFGETSEGIPYPKGAHYLPFPSMSATHVRELLADMGVIQHGTFDTHPYFDEAAILHAPDERLFDPATDTWLPGLLKATDAEDKRQQAKFFSLTNRLKSRRGADGKRLFDIPIAASSVDTAWRGVDQLTFGSWLKQQGFTSPGLLSYLDYACRDDYGAGIHAVSAWAGLQYFAGRDGHAANAEEGGLLTWPAGLGHVVQWLSQQLPANRWMSGMVARLVPSATGVQVYLQSGAKKWRVDAGRVICATPLHVAKHLLPLAEYGFDERQHMPVHSPWLVSNFFLDDFPAEKAGEGLAWDNVVAGSQGLGYVVATHQWIRQYRPEKTVFTAYRTLPIQDAASARRWLASATPDALLDAAMVDLETVYGAARLKRHLSGVEITVRAHAMATPTPGFLSNAGLQRLREQSGQVLFAHSDLSGYSVFEEAAWWGYQAAHRLLGA